MGSNEMIAGVESVDFRFWCEDENTQNWQEISKIEDTKIVILKKKKRKAGIVFHVKSRNNIRHEK